MVRYIQVSPRGFSNETYIAMGTAEQVRKLNEIVNNNPERWARPILESSPEVRAIKREAKRYGEPLTSLIVQITGGTK